MVTRQLKLRPTVKQGATLNEWLWMLTGVHNWASRKIELDASDGIYHSRFDLINLIAEHGAKIGVPSHAIQGQVRVAHESWARCFQKISKKPRLKGKRNKLSSISFPDPFRAPKNGRIRVPNLGKVHFHKQGLPEGKIKCGRILKKANGWYLSLVIDAAPNAIPITGNGEIGIDPGFKNLLTLSSGTKIEHPRELEAGAKRLAQAQRGENKKLVSRLHAHIANQRKDRNHKLSRSLVSENGTIFWSKDNTKAISKKFGKSVSSSAHSQLRQFISYKAQSCGREYAEVANFNSTRQCSRCEALTGPHGISMLKVRFWKCSACGAELDRDVNAALNTLRIGRGLRHENIREGMSETFVNL